jgi:transcriptional regulator with XRE-family HTH domain
MPSGLPWSEEFIHEIADPEMRHELVRDQVRTRLALLIRTLRDQDCRKWSQTELGRRMGKPQSVVSRIEDPDYGKLSLQTLFELAEAFELPLWVDLPEWEDWFRRIREVRVDELCRESFDADALINKAKHAREGVTSGAVIQLQSERVSTQAGDWQNATKLNGADFSFGVTGA